MWLCRALPHGRGRKDRAIDYQATLNTYQKEVAGASHYVLLSAICVQKAATRISESQIGL